MKLALATLALLLAVPCGADSPDSLPRPDPLNPVGENLQVPPDWHVRLDDPDAAVTIGPDAATADIRFVSMTPGWHVTTGPRAILYHPASTATGNFHADAKIHLFPPGERREAFGLLFGGRDLDGEALAYDYFVIRKSGEFLVKRRHGDKTTTLIPWTAHEAIVAYGPETEGTATNLLGITADSETVRFEVNGIEVARLSREEVPANGVVGFRVNHHLNLHISTLEIEALP